MPNYGISHKISKTISFFDGIKHSIEVDSKEGVEQLHIVVKKSFDELMKIFKEEGFTNVKFEHKQPFSNWKWFES